VTIDLATFDVNKAFCINWFNTKGGKDIKRSVGALASMTFVPCIVIAYWIGEETNWHPDALNSIRSLIDFYGYTNIENKPPGAPI